MINTHSHVYDEAFSVDRDAVVERCRAAGIAAIVLPNIDVASMEPMFDVVKRYPDLLYPTLGLHPTSVDSNYKTTLSTIFQNPCDTIVGIGEIGIDLYHNDTFVHEQKLAFDYQLDMAVKRHLPVLIHSRKSFDEIYDILQTYRGSGLTGVMHCFSGDYRQAKLILDMGFYIGVGGVVTFDRAKIAGVVARLPLCALVLETDDPYLAPVPHRGRRNEPSFVTAVAAKIAELHNVPFQTVAEITEENAKKLFPMLNQATNK